MPQKPIGKFYDSQDISFPLGRLQCHALKLSYEHCLRAFPSHSHSSNSWDFLSLYFKMTYFPLLSHFSVSYNQSNNTFKLIKAPEFVVPLSYGTQFVVLSVSPSRTLS